jgi:uncharacterized protein
MLPELESLKDRIADLCRAHGVLRLDVFGSAARGKDFDPRRSDVDVLVQFDPGLPPSFDRYLSLRDALAELTGRPVDLAMVGAIKNPHLKASIDAHRELLFAA